MALISQQSMDYLRAIETLSKTEEDLQKNMNAPGPGGEARDRTPTPPPSGQKGKLVMLGARARQILEKAAGRIPNPSEVMEKTSKEAERLQRRVAVFLKHNGAILAGLAVGALAVWAGREYWKRHQW